MQVNGMKEEIEAVSVSASWRNGPVMLGTVPIQESIIGGSPFSHS